MPCCKDAFPFVSEFLPLLKHYNGKSIKRTISAHRLDPNPNKVFFTDIIPVENTIGINTTGGDDFHSFSTIFMLVTLCGLPDIQIPVGRFRNCY